MPAWERRQATYDAIVSAFANPGAVDRSNDVLTADRLTLSNTRSDAAAASNVFSTLQARQLGKAQANIDALNALGAEIVQERALRMMGDLADAYRTSGMTGATGDPIDLMTPTPMATSGGAPAAGNGDRWIPDANGAGGTLIGRRMTPAEEAAFDAENAPPPSSRTDSIRELGPVEGFFTFDPVGRGLKGVGGGALDAWLALPRAIVGVGNLARDAVGYTVNAISPQRSVLTGQAFDYQFRSGLIRGVQQNGLAGSIGMGITGAVRSAPGIGLIGALGSPNRDWGQVGAQALNTGLSGAGMIGSLRGGTTATRVPDSFFEIVTEVPISGSSRSAHRTSANRNLAEQMRSDPVYAKAINAEFGADVLAHMQSGKSGLRNPPGTEWHHPKSDPLTMWLLRREVHRDPSLQQYLHGGNSGGFAEHYGRN